jgi:hypothetical protein
MIARLRSWLASWTAAETAEGVPRPPPAPSLPPRVVDAAVVAVVAVLNAGYLLSSVYVHAARGGGRPQLGPGDWSLRAVLGTICLPAVAALWWRRDHPIGVLGIALAALVVAYPYPSLFAIVALYSAALRVPLRTALLAGAAAALCRIAGVATFRGSRPSRGGCAAGARSAERCWGRGGPAMALAWCRPWRTVRRPSGSTGRAARKAATSRSRWSSSRCGTA